MTDNVASLNARRAELAHDNSLWSPAECLLDLLTDIESGKIRVDKLLVLRLNVGDDKKDFDVGYNAANISASTAIATMEAAKLMLLADMGYCLRKGG